MSSNVEIVINVQESGSSNKSPLVKTHITSSRRDYIRKGCIALCVLSTLILAATDVDHIYGPFAVLYQSVQMQSPVAAKYKVPPGTPTLTTLSPGLWWLRSDQSSEFDGHMNSVGALRSRPRHTDSGAEQQGHELRAKIIPFFLATLGLAAWALSHSVGLPHHHARAMTVAAAFPSAGLVALLSAMIANAVTTSLTFPLDTIKTHQQSDTSESPKRHPSFASLFLGISPVLLVGIPCCGMYFMLFENLQGIWNPQQSFFGDLLCACTAQIFAGTFMIPADAIKVNMQTGAYPTMRAASTGLLQQGLNGGLCTSNVRQGMALTYLRDFSFAAVQMLIYTTLHRYGGFLGAFAGAIAASAACLISNPFDAIRTRRMLSEDKSANPAPLGMKDYFAGIAPRLLLSAISGFVFFRTYEAAKPFVHSALVSFAQ